MSQWVLVLDSEADAVRRVVRSMPEVLVAIGVLRNCNDTALTPGHVGRLCDALEVVARARLVNVEDEWHCVSEEDQARLTAALAQAKALSARLDETCIVAAGSSQKAVQRAEAAEQRVRALIEEVERERLGPKGRVISDDEKQRGQCGLCGAVVDGFLCYGHGRCAPDPRMNEILRQARIDQERAKGAAQRSRELLEETKALRDERNTAATLASNGAWFWAEHNENDLESMSDGMTIIVTAGNLRRVIAEATEQREPPNDD